MSAFIRALEGEPKTRTAGACFAPACCSVRGANDAKGTFGIFSCASCTTNCITPIVEVIGRRIGIRKAVMTSVHAVDGPDRGFRRGRAAAANLVPATTGATLATARALPQYEGLIDGVAICAPVPVGSLADLTFVTSRKTSVEEVNHILAEGATSTPLTGPRSRDENCIPQRDTPPLSPIQAIAIQ